MLHLAAAYRLGPYSIEKKGTHGVFGVAAALLPALLLLSRRLVFSAELNATLRARRTAGAPETYAERGDGPAVSGQASVITDGTSASRADTRFRSG